MECPAYSSLRSNFLVSLQEKLGDGFEHFQSLAPLLLVVNCGRINLVPCLTC